MITYHPSMKFRERPGTPASPNGLFPGNAFSFAGVLHRQKHSGFCCPGLCTRLPIITSTLPDLTWFPGVSTGSLTYRDYRSFREISRTKEICRTNSNAKALYCSIGQSLRTPATNSRPQSSMVWGYSLQVERLRH